MNNILERPKAENVIFLTVPFDDLPTEPWIGFYISPYQKAGCPKCGQILRNNTAWNAVQLNAAARRADYSSLSTSC